MLAYSEHVIRAFTFLVSKDSEKAQQKSCSDHIFRQVFFFFFFFFFPTKKSIDFLLISPQKTYTFSKFRVSNDKFKDNFSYFSLKTYVVGTH